MQNLQKSKPIPTGEVLESVGYGTIVQDPQRITQSIGFKLALAEFGLTEELITTSLVDDIKAKPKARVKELSLGAEILGMKKREEEPEKKIGGNTYNFIFSEKVQAEIKKTEEIIKAQLIKPHVTEN